MSADAKMVPVAFLKTWVDPVYGVAKRVDLDDRLDDWMPRPVQVAPLYSADTIAALKKDAERLDWLDKHPREATIRVGTDMKACVFYGVSCDPKWTMREAIDAAIDAAQSTEMKLTKEKAMQPHQQRVVDEKAELDARREKLTAFLAGDICRTLPAEEQHRLGRQATIMAQYSQILGERIDAF